MNNSDLACKIWLSGTWMYPNTIYDLAAIDCGLILPFNNKLDQVSYDSWHFMSS